MNAGLYLHAPFCKSKCNYCDFYRITDLSLITAFVNAVEAEMKAIDKSFPISTIYIGGGTPTVLGAESLEKIIQTIKTVFDTSHVEEFTVECNPEDVNESLIEMLQTNGVNRISLGVQSLDNKILRQMNRRHSATKVIAVIDLLKKMNFSNISVDMIFGLPKNPTYDLKADIDKFINLDVDHISAYALTYEKGSMFTKMLESGQIEKQSDDEVALQYEYLINTFKSAGYEHYEISNFARNGQYSRHNMGYWRRRPYYGVGPGASGFDGKIRYKNIEDVEQYVVSALTGHAYSEQENLTEKDVYNEILMLGLRTKYGLQKADIQAVNPEYTNYFSEKVKPYLNDKTIIETPTAYIMDERKWFISDNILSHLFL